jgi:hypothetical protein
LIPNVKVVAIPAKKKFADLAAGNRIFYWRGLPNHWHCDVGVAWTGSSSYTAWPGDFGDRISMGQKVPLNRPSMAARSVSKNQVEKAELSRSVRRRRSHGTRFCSKYFRSSA